MPALAISDHGNMFGVFEFVAEAYKHKDENGNVKVKPLLVVSFISQQTGIRKHLPKNKKIPAITRYCWQKMKKVIATW